MKNFKDSKYKEEEIDTNNSFIKNYWYPEFRDIYFFKSEETSSTILKKTLNKEISLVIRTNYETKEKEWLNAIVGDINYKTGVITISPNIASEVFTVYVNPFYPDEIIAKDEVYLSLDITTTTPLPI